MVAGQQKRPLTNICAISNNGDEEFSSEKRKINIVLSKWFQTMRPHIALEWDDTQMKAVARKGQVGITWRHLLPFYGPSPHHSCMDLADVFTIPEELYELKDLKDVFTYEVWQSCFSDSERKLLSEFLPKGFDAEIVVQSLLLGHNFHFGNPFIGWSSLLCSGGMHPDAIRLSEAELRANKKVYYSEVRKYHNNMLETLQMWREAWQNCRNPEMELPDRKWQGSQKHDVAKMHVMSEEGNTVISSSKKQEKLHATFEESRKNVLVEHWIFLVQMDLPEAYAKFVESHLQRHLQRNHLQKEILEHRKFVSDKARCKENLIDSETLCYTKEGAQIRKEIDLSQLKNLPVHAIAEVEEQEKSNSEFTKLSSDSSTQYGAHKPSDSEESSDVKTLTSTEIPPVQVSGMWSPTPKMTPQATKYEQHRNCLSETENPKPVKNVFSDARLKQCSGLADEQPVCRDDVLSSVKETLSTTNVDCPGFSSHYDLGSARKECSNLLPRKRPIFWAPSKLAEENSVDDSMRRSISEEGPDKRPCFSLEKTGPLQNVVSQQDHFPSQRDQPADNQNCSFLVNTDKKAGAEGHLLHFKQPMSSKNPIGELEMQPFNKRQGYVEMQILSLGKDHPSALSLQQAEYLDKKCHLNLSSEFFEEQHSQNTMHSSLLGDLTNRVSVPNMQADKTHSLILSSSNGIQARGRQSGLNHEINWDGNNFSLPCVSARGPTQQGFQHVFYSAQDLQFFTDIKSKELNHPLQRRDSNQSGKQDGFGDNVQEQQIFWQNHHQENQSHIFKHTEQKQSLQASGQQDLFFPGLSPAAVPNWNGPLHAIPWRPLPATAMPQLEQHPNHVNGINNPIPASWSPPNFLQKPSTIDHGHTRSNSERELFGLLPQWDSLPQSTNGVSNHDQYGDLKIYTSIGFCTSNNGHSQEDWIQLQHSHANPSYPYEISSIHRAGYTPCRNISPISYPSSEIAHFRQMSSGLQNINGQGPSLNSPWNL
ncbi:uncharacterized protein LOC131070742 isoform X2 [Cryptomeria japonica]|uniref:uncharacterized protein LOC131070742 isoform X2 n=1 Tax=Cryptomeria japonica TaxID=3369 RepID=UPI0027DA4C4B|nr:uncharacterized protein LOC131070742 isoform X2 [Cryptomeria japonica]